jgi:phage virion morphogenesis protein
MADALISLETWVEPMLAAMTSTERRGLARRIGIELRRSQHIRIQNQKNPDGSSYLPRKRARDKAGRIKRNAEHMFRRISRSNYLRLQADDAGVAVGFVGRVARIARVHQEGLVDRISREGATARYPIRELLGFTDEDRARIRELLEAHFGQ